MSLLAKSGISREVTAGGASLSQKTAARFSEWEAPSPRLPGFPSLKKVEKKRELWRNPQKYYTAFVYFVQFLFSIRKNLRELVDFFS